MARPASVIAVAITMVFGMFTTPEAYVYGEWLGMVVAHAPDISIDTIDLGVFNYSGALTILGNELISTSTVGYIETVCEQNPPPFRYTPYRVRANWTQPGALGARLPADPTGRRVARGLRWWVCDWETRSWRTSQTSDCGVAHSSAEAAMDAGIAASPGTPGGDVILTPGTLLVTHVCTAGTYVLGATPCGSGAPNAAECITCMDGWYGCACEFHDSTFAKIDPVGAAVAWTISTLISLPYFVQAVVVGVLCVRARFAARRTGSAVLDSSYALLNGLRALVHAAAASLLLSHATDLLITRPGNSETYAGFAVAFAVVFLLSTMFVLMWRGRRACESLPSGRFAPSGYDSISRSKKDDGDLAADDASDADSVAGDGARSVPTSRRERQLAVQQRSNWIVAFTIVGIMAFALESFAFAWYMNLKQSTEVLTTSLEAVLMFAQIFHVFVSHDEVRADGPMHRVVLLTLCLICAAFAFVFPMPLFEAPCAGTTSAGA